jgi:hypothetical protein
MSFDTATVLGQTERTMMGHAESGLASPLPGIMSMVITSIVIMSIVTFILPR